MFKLFLLGLALLAGCSPVIDAQLRLLDASRKGVAAVAGSIDGRQEVLASLEATRRAALDAAFDADVRGQASLTDVWVIEARTAYATAIEQFDRQQQQGRRSADADRANLAAIDSALRQVQALNRAQLRLDPFQEK